MGCGGSYHWNNVRPIQESAITQELKDTDLLNGRRDVHISAYVIPDKEHDTPELRLIITGNFEVGNATKLKELVSESEEIMVRLMQQEVDTRDTSRLKIYLTGYDGSKKVKVYEEREWKTLDKTLTDSELRTRAENLQKQVAKQRGW